jgi:hypothetical protein
MLRMYLLATVLTVAMASTIFFQPGLSGRLAYASDIMAEIGQPFSLGFNQTANVQDADIDLRFTDVTDSRCPSDVVCIWEGQVSILVDIQDSKDGLVQFNLTLRGSPEAPNTRSFGNYSITLVDVQPYPVSTQQISQSEYIAKFLVESSKNQLSTHAVLVKAHSDESPLSVVVAGWSVASGKGVAVLSMQDAPKRVIVKFTPLDSGRCAHQDAIECIDGQVTETSNSGVVELGGNLHLEIDRGAALLYFEFSSVANNDYSFDILRFKVWEKQASGNNNLVYLKEGQRDGPLLVQKIFSDHIEGLNFVEYPISTDQGSPITMQIGEKTTNGCTVMLTLVRIEEDKAVFSKTIDENRPCPICWLQAALLSRLK